MPINQFNFLEKTGSLTESHLAYDIDKMASTFCNDVGVALPNGLYIVEVCAYAGPALMKSAAVVSETPPVGMILTCGNGSFKSINTISRKIKSRRHMKKSNYLR